MNPKFFPTILIVMSVFSAVGYVPAGDWRKVAYWLAGATITFVVTY